MKNDYLLMKHLLFIPALVLALSGCLDDDEGTTSSSGATDPLYSSQWHLLNTGQLGMDGSAATRSEDINVVPVWESCGTEATCRGEGIVVSVVDDGVEIAHEDLAANILSGGSYNYTNGSTNPTPVNPEDNHGTSVAGIIASRDGNPYGGVGIAPRSQLVGYNLLASLPTELNQADAMTRGMSIVDISNNSWGPVDGIGQLAYSHAPWRTAVENGVNSGRNGLGVVYLWAGGNGYFQSVDNSNYDGFANNPYVFAVGAYNHRGVKASYSEPGANILITGPAGEFCPSLAITTTDLMGEQGINKTGSADLSNRNYTQCMDGTSAATPMVAGVVALMLQANPELTWRDVRRIVAETARRIDDGDVGWTTNGAGFEVNHKYGFGAIDAGAAVTAARNWTNIPEQQIFETTLKAVGDTIPDNNLTGLTDTISVSGSDVSTIEFVQIEFSASDHNYGGNLIIELTSPDGTKSILSEQHACSSFEGSDAPFDGCIPFDAWEFGSVRHMGESADGDWTIRVVDSVAEDVGTFESWKLTFFGY